ncbi:phosphoadenosine phosphosulfate reductase family protein [Gemmata sp. G18]|uniref:Phosphoadenosine phosphosulfate reductase family protein n=1 Tax=Gemmata palustris TaxID=2822762 RepID=A0ABS5BNX9_9BACT|nr:phosphoadenosine phosphosulfate reductase family protein [Gemmata palustris]MBP3955365.1 phosphoadenosine phosphosulfate reductase family protein [Gemmata palustris]
MTTPRHILMLSGGKDSTALAIHMRGRVPGMEYVFCDTDKELPETYEYLSKIEYALGIRITRLRDDRGFDHWLKVKGGYLPSSRMRWCTHVLKMKPFEKYVGNDQVQMYVGIRADEDRTAYVSTRPNIVTVLPFVEEGIVAEDVRRILDESGVGLPDYYSWRTRSGCYFCFFQRRMEWVGLLEKHPELFELSKQYEKINEETGERYTWNQRESLEELSAPERVREIKARHQKAMEGQQKKRVNLPLLDVLDEVLEDESDEPPCFMCHT